MANINCPKCGEEYSETYRKCPFCQEEEAIRKGRPMHRTGKRLSKKKRNSGAAGVLLLLALYVLMKFMTRDKGNTSNSPQS